MEKKMVLQYTRITIQKIPKLFIGLPNLKVSKGLILCNDYVCIFSQSNTFFATLNMARLLKLHFVTIMLHCSLHTYFIQVLINLHTYKPLYSIHSLLQPTMYCIDELIKEQRQAQANSMPFKGIIRPLFHSMHIHRLNCKLYLFFCSGQFCRNPLSSHYGILSRHNSVNQLFTRCTLFVQI